MNHYGVTHIKGVEDQSIYVLPNVPSNSGDDGIVFIGAAAKRPKFFKARGEGAEVREEEHPNFTGPGASEEKMVGILILVAGGAGGGVCKRVPKTPLVGGEALTLSHPAKNLALQGGRISPDLFRQDVHL
jgi:hypothetical protein